jgi:hypothetical protein
MKKTQINYISCCSYIRRKKIMGDIEYTKNGVNIISKDGKILKNLYYCPYCNTPLFMVMSDNYINYLSRASLTELLNVYFKRYTVVERIGEIDIKLSNLDKRLESVLDFIRPMGLIINYKKLHFWNNIFRRKKFLIKQE